MTSISENLYHITLYTAEHKPHLEGNLRRMVEHAFKSLPGRYPGLKIVRHEIHPNRVEMLLDLHRLDEDLPRIVQSFKSEVKGLAKKDGFSLHTLWQWTYEEREVESKDGKLEAK
jgi:hypothetical protein